MKGIFNQSGGLNLWRSLFARVAEEVCMGEIYYRNILQNLRNNAKILIYHDSAWSKLGMVIRRLNW